MDWSIPKFPLDDICDQALTWLTGHGSDLTRAVSKVVTGWIEVSTDALVAVPPWLTIAAFVALAWRIGGMRIAVLHRRRARLSLEPAPVAADHGNPRPRHALDGRGAPHRHPDRHCLRRCPGGHGSTVGPCLDMAQTMPSFVYLIPAIPFFGLGSVSACFATIIFAMPPVIRLTALGIRQVPHELIEASDAFGSTPVQKLFKVQFRSRCRRSWPASTRPSCWRCRWW